MCDGYRLANHDRQIQLDSALDFLLFSLGDIAADGLRRALHRLGGLFQTGQHLDLLAAVIESRLLADQSLHAAHRWRKLSIFYVQFHIRRELAIVTVGAQIIGP